MAKIKWKTKAELEQEAPLTPFELLLKEVETLKKRIEELENKQV